ncbi:MAG TPA: GNAT family N-acetyltransferase [Gemmatimonadales bacterium]|jgi:GNAT superfamily N-acetyltransferase
MWRSDRSLVGPLLPTRSDIDALNRVFSEAFTERYRRDGLSGVRVPYLNPAIWHYAIDDAGDGAMIWRDGRGELVAFNMVHRSGSEGWMGPLAVRTDRQGHGEGQTIVMAGVTWLQAQGVATIGLETMPRTTDNIGFYSRLGFLPGQMTITLQRDRLRDDGAAGIRLGALPRDAQVGAMASCRALAAVAAPGVDFTREIDLTLSHQLGDVTMMHRGGELRAFALWHTAPLAQGRGSDELRVLKLVAPDVETTMELLGAIEREAVIAGMHRMAIRCQTRQDELYAALLADRFRVHWTDLRMTLAGYAEVPPRGVLLSNWEI